MVEAIHLYYNNYILEVDEEQVEPLYIIYVNEGFNISEELIWIMIHQQIKG